MSEQCKIFSVDLSLESLSLAKQILFNTTYLCKISQDAYYEEKLPPIIFELNLIATGLNIDNESRGKIFYQYYKKSPRLTWDRNKVWVEWVTFDNYVTWQEFILKIIDTLWGGLIEIELEELENCLYLAFERHDKKVIDALLFVGGKLSGKAIEYIVEDGPSWFMQTKYRRDIPDQLKPYFYEAKLLETEEKVI